MPKQRPGETISQFAIRTAWETGQFWDPADEEGLEIRQSDLPKLSASDPVVVRAMIRMAKIDMTRYAKHVLNTHGRMPDFDGELGPAMESFLVDSDSRCPVPDFAPPPGVSFHYDDPDLQKVVERMQADYAMPAFGIGNWKGCHNVGEFHCASVGVNTSNLPSFLQPVFLQVLKNVQLAYAGVGLLFRFIKDGRDMLTGESFSGIINTQFSFVQSSQGWIGLAILGQGQTCGSTIWCKYLATYRGGNSDAAVVQQWTTLIKHELGHNCNRNHTNGGVMNPSIVNGLPTEWGANDPSTPWLKQQFGGVPVPIPGGGDVPPPPPTTLEARVDAMAVELALVNAKANWAVAKLKEMGK